MPVYIVTSFSTELVMQHTEMVKGSGAPLERPGFACVVCTVPIQFQMR